MALTAKQTAFAREYVVDHCAAKAMVRAGYAKRSACQHTDRNMRNPEVQALIAKHEADIAKRCEVSVDNIVEGLRKIAFDEDAFLPSRVKCFELLGKHLGMWPRIPRVEDAAGEGRMVLVSPMRSETVDDWNARVDAELGHGRGGKPSH